MATARQPIMSVLTDYFVKLVEISDGTPVPEDMLFVKLMLIKQNGRPLSAEDPTRENILSEREIMFPFSDLDLSWPQIFSSEETSLADEVLLSMLNMDVPTHKHTKIIDAVYKVAVDAVPGQLAIHVGIGDTVLPAVHSGRHPWERPYIMPRNAEMYDNTMESMSVDESVFIDDLKALMAKFPIPVNIDYSVFREPPPNS